VTERNKRFNPPPGWPRPPAGWIPPKGWTPDPSWPMPPPGWTLWVSTEPTVVILPQSSVQPVSTESTVGPGEAQPKSDSLSHSGTKIDSPSPESDVEDLVTLDDERVLQDVGIYRYHHPLEHAEAYKVRLAELEARIAALVISEKAIEKSNLFTFDNSLAKGRKMTSDLSRLMLRAYNAEAENSIRSLRVGNVVTAKKRLEASRAAIKKLGRMMEMHIGDEFHAMRLEEIELTADYLMKKQAEREDAREERARLREERKVAAELAAEKELLEKERSHLVNALESLRSGGASDPDLQDKLDKIDQAIARNEYRTANIRAGYVYVISNRGAFGDGVVKIGLTRRLEPEERVDELGGASVPFRFDIHALFFSEDAVTLEAELHRHFASRRLNQVNARKEFFFATPEEVRAVLVSRIGNLLEFKDRSDSTEYLQSLRYWPDGHRRGG
jgi:Domain of unknown function (DUF4041)/Meiotically up-regulated gene 113